MDTPPVTFYQRGDKVMARLASGWTPSRVIGQHHELYVKVAASSPFSYYEGTRKVPVGTPSYFLQRPESIRFLQHDPNWNPYGVAPFLTPSEYALMGGVAGWATPDIPGLQHVGAYIAGTDYDEGDPAWVWEKDSGWHPAVVINGQRSWISVRFADNFRLPNGWPSKSYRPAKVWPAICDHPDPVRKITVDEKWSQTTDLEWAAELARHLGNRSPLRRHPGL
ncbi:hypothetical protein AB0J80_09365 [Actinoplanes sp. NPDC049548]|uniref:hypothetical protein n=1 Tax=Actinoplanes sp. NPDC049548 TaxID=3155152 RepID=UPI003420072B